MTTFHVASTADIPALCDLLDALFSQEAEFTPNRDAQMRGLGAIINDPSIGHVLGASQDGRVVGMTVLLYTISTALGARVALLEDMVVMPQERGRGIGSQLLNYALAFARDNGCRRITLLTDDLNIGARRFYVAHGFAESDMKIMRYLY